MAGVAYLGISTSSWADLALVADEMAVIAALAITVLVKAGLAAYSAAAFPRHRHRTASGLTSPTR